MKRVFLVLAILLCISAFAMGQHLTIDNSGSTVKSLPLGNTWGNDILTFYESLNGGKVILLGQVVRSDGSLGPKIQPYALDVDWTNWTAAWSGLSNSYLLVYTSEDKVYARSIRHDGVPKSGARLVMTGFTGKQLFLTFTAKKRFVLFYEKNGDVIAQVLKKTGAKKGTEKVITTSTTGRNSLITSVSTMNNGDVILYYSEFDPGTMETDLKLMRLDFKLKQKADYTIQKGLKALNETYARNYLGVCDYGADQHLVVWNPGLGKLYYALINHDGTFLKKKKKLSKKHLFPEQILFDSTSDLYRVLYTSLFYNGNRDIEKYYITSIRDDATFAKKEKYIASSSYETDDRAFCVSRDGNILITWSPEALQALKGYFIKY